MFIPQKNESLLMFGKWTTRIGNILFDYVNSMIIVKGSPAASFLLALYQSGETIISVIFNLVGGVIADGGSKKGILIVTDIISALICFVLSFSMFCELSAVSLILANILLAIIHSFNAPTYKSITRELVEKDRIELFFSISNGGNEVIMVVGPILCACLVDVVGTRGALLIDSITFLLSALSEIMLVPLKTHSSKKKLKSGMIRGIASGLRYLANEKRILMLVILSAMVNFFLAGYNLLLPFTDKMYNSVCDSFYSKALVAQAIGGILGSAFCASPKKKTDEQKLATFLGLTGAFLIFIPVSYSTKNIILCLVPFVGFNASLSVFNIKFMTYTQMCVDPKFAGRVFSIIFTIAVLFMPVGSLAFSFLCNSVEISNYYFVGGGIVLLTLFFNIIGYIVVGKGKLINEYSSRN